MAKYKNYKQLAAAFASGKLDRKKWAIELDKGGMDASLRPTGFTGKETDDEVDALHKKGEKLFSPEYADHIEDLYAALGIPVQWC